MAFTHPDHYSHLIFRHLIFINFSTLNYVLYPYTLKKYSFEALEYHTNDTQSSTAHRLDLSENLHAARYRHRIATDSVSDAD